ncbi:MAG TPA: prolipoprotein diacylglyceryl transferase family protein [Gemmataceae bacterium]
MEPRYYYALFMFLALLAFVIVRRLQPKASELLRMPWWQRTALTLAAFVGGVLGAKASFALTETHEWFDYHDWFRAWFRDGKTITTGLIGAYLAVEMAKLALGIRVKTGDSFALPLACAMAVGRWGCFLNGCCYGTPTTLPWGVSFHLPDGDVVRCHPTQIYESLFHLTMASVLLLLMRYDLLRYQRLKLYLICYCVYRFVTEFIRPEPIWWAGLTFYQWAAIVLAAGLVVHWVWDSRLVKSERGLAAA